MEQPNLQNLSSTIIAANLAKVSPTNMSGAVNGMVWKSPSGLDHVDTLKGITKPHWSFEYTFYRNSKNQIGPYNHGICVDDKQFPAKCATCGESFDHVELMEVGVPVGRVSNKLTVQTSQEEANRIFYAMRNLRIWYAIPFCEQHHLKDGKSIASKGEANQGPNNTQIKKISLQFMNKEYGRAFGEINQLPGTWHQSSIVGDVQFNNPEEVEGMKKPWWLKTALIRIPFYLASLALFILLMSGCMSSDGSIDLAEPEGFLMLIEFVGMVVVAVIAQFLGHYPAGNRPRMKKES